MEYYQIGDYVVPTDLPQRFVCRVANAHAVGATGMQVLELKPLHGPWPQGTRLFRGGESVRSASPNELWSVSTGSTQTAPRQRAARQRHVRHVVSAVRRASRDTPDTSPPGAA